jgi:hypothetical protein
VCQRWMRLLTKTSLRRECLDSFLLLSERHLYRIVKEYASYFNDI